ncbi:putative phage protein (TIGR02220 family) [Cytobacillus horneckiae]
MFLVSIIYHKKKYVHREHQFGEGESMQKSYYAIIPANVRYDEELTPNAKLLYGEITALCNEKGYCWASNSYFADLYRVSKVSISKWINQLIEKGYLNSEIIYKEGTKEILNRYLTIVNAPIKEKLNTPIKEKFKDNNTSFNTTSNNKKEYIPYVEIVNYLNDAASSNYRSSTKKTKDLIKARYNEGFAEEDFKKVIDIKTAEWLKDEKMNKFLRPETLFGTKFESYLNQKGGKANGTDPNASKIADEYDFGF